jgi:L-threonylcarbamoyladenylate synthase
MTGRTRDLGAAHPPAAGASLGPDSARAFEDWLAADGVILFPADTVYGLACDPGSEAAVARLYALKGRAPGKPAAVMVFGLERALELVAAGARLQRALRALLPGPVTVLVPNPERRFALACADDPDTLGLRVPRLAPALSALADVRRPLLQSSANLAGGPEAVVLSDVPAPIRQGVDLELDGGRLPGVASTVVDLRRYPDQGSWRVMRAGALSADEVGRLLGERAPGPRPLRVP